MTIHQGPAQPANRPLSGVGKPLGLAGALLAAPPPRLALADEMNSLDWDPCTIDQDAFYWMHTAGLHGRNERPDWWEFVRVAVARAQSEPPVWGWCVEGFVVPIYVGHLVYKGVTYIAPALFNPCWAPHTVVFKDRVVHVFVDGKWHCGALRPETVDENGAEDVVLAADTYLASADE